jgi:quinol-cytochrome oxidoreductase complex cytochrome b subunit
MYRKGIIFLLLLAVSVTGMVFAQEEGGGGSGGYSGIQHWISGEASLLGAGVRYEYMLNEKFSIGANVFFNSFFLLWNSLGVNVTGRYYFWRGLYGELGLGYGWLSGTGTYTGTQTSYRYDSNWNLVPYTSNFSAPASYQINGVMIAPAVGYKIDFSDPGGFFICPMFSLPVVIGGKKFNYLGASSKAGVGINIKAGIGLGYAF